MEVNDERNSVKVRMQPESETIENLYGGWKRSACYSYQWQAGIY